MIERISPSAKKYPFRPIRPTTNYHTLIPIITAGLPPRINVRHINKYRDISWAKGSVIYLKGGTDLICSEEGGGIYILVGGKTKIGNK